jgi:hypothetical protein
MDRTNLMLGLLLLTIAAAGCSGSGIPGASATPTVTAPAAESRTVTLDDDHQTLTLHVGERFLLKLGDTLTWQVTVSDESVVSRVPNVTVVKGAQGIYEAKKIGQATLNGAGSPICAPNTACPQLIRAFTVSLEVAQ